MKNISISIILVLSIDLCADFVSSGYNEEVEHRYKEASEQYTEACENGSAVGCLLLSIIYQDGKKGVKQNKSRANQLYAKGCKLYIKDIKPSGDSCDVVNIKNAMMDLRDAGIETTELNILEYLK